MTTQTIQIDAPPTVPIEVASPRRGSNRQPVPSGTEIHELYSLAKYKIHCWIEEVSPVRAQALLDTSIGNRKLSAKYVSIYVKAMKSGEWHLNGEALIIDDKGRFRDGHHRMHAVVGSGVTVPMLMISGITDEAIRTIDNGKKRMVADVLSANGCPHPFVIAAGMNWVRHIEEGDANMAPTFMKALDAIEFWEDNKALVERAGYHGARCGRILQPSLGMAAYYLFARINEAQAEQFFEDLFSGADLRSTDPVWVLRELLLKGKKDTIRLARLDLMTRTIRAWNSRRQGASVKQIRGLAMNSDGSYQPIPKPI